MKAIIVGSNGYLGQNLSLSLLSKGVDLICTDIHDQTKLIAHSALFRYIPLDITNSVFVDEFIWDADVLYFLAGLTGTRASIENAEAFTRINELGLINVLNALIRQKTGCRVIFPSSRLVYKGSELPLKEESEKEFRTVYAINKYACEKMLSIFSGYYGIDYTVFRICVLYGDIGAQASSYGTIEFMMKQARQGTITLYGDGVQRRTFVHVGDISNILFLGAQKQDTRNGVFNVGGEVFSLREIAGMIAKKEGALVSFKDWPPVELSLESGDTIFNSDKIDDILSYKYQYSFADFIKSSVV